MKNIPRVSIIMGIYNCADTLNEAIDSILAQTFNEWELIMCDDGSVDTTYDVALGYVQRYSEKIFLLKNSENKGLNYTLNRCLSYAKGDYIARMDGDDISLPERIEREVDFLDHHPEYAIVSTPMIYFDNMGDWGRGKAIEIPQLKDFVFHAPFHCHAPCMIRREAFEKVKGYTVDKRLLRYEDCNLWYKLYAAGFRGYNLQQPLYKMRDDKEAYKRRTPKTRLRAVYVQYVGFKMIGMPLRYYPYLMVEFLKSVAIILLPEKLYVALHKKKQR